MEVKRFEQAGELYEGIDAHREAIDVYVEGGLVDKARELAQSANLTDHFNSAMQRRLGGEYRREPLKEPPRQDVPRSAPVRPSTSGGGVTFEMLAQHGEWGKALEVAKSQVIPFERSDC